MRIAALILGLIAGALALAAPLLFKADLLSLFVENWPASAGGRQVATAFWYALPLMALGGAVVALIVPGFAALLLLGAAVGWASIGLGQPDLLDHRLLGPAGVALVAGILAQLSAELRIHRKRKARREEREDANAVLDVGEIEREAALRVDPTLVPRDEAPPPPRRAVPLTLEDVTVTERPAPAPPPSRPEPEILRPSAADDDGWREPFRPQGAAARRSVGFRWEDDDEPGMDGSQDRPRPSPRFEPREQSARTERAERVEFVARPTPPPTRLVDVEPEPVRPEPEIRMAPPPRRNPPPRGGGVLAPVLAGIAAVLFLGALLAGGYYVWRGGYLDGLIAAVQPQPAATPSPDAVADAAPAAEVSPPAAVTVPVATPTPGSPAPEPAAVAVPAPTPSLPVVLPQPAGPATALMTTYDDPFAYCQAVGTIDYPDGRYSGPPVVSAMTQLLRAPADATRDRVHWRCMSGSVLACASYAGPICDTAPTVEEMTAYCARNPDAKPLFAPHGIWSCVAGQPQLPENANWPVDARGFMPRAWITVSPPAAQAAETPAPPAP